MSERCGPWEQGRLLPEVRQYKEENLPECIEVSWRNTLFLSKKQAAVQHFLGVIIQFNESRILVALCAVKARGQVAVMSWRKTLQKEDWWFFFSSLSCGCGFPLEEAELWITGSWAQPAGSLRNQHHEPCCQLVLELGNALVCVFPLRTDVPTESPWRHPPPLLWSMENTEGNTLQLSARTRGLNFYS